jgi:hypothetical protein
MAKEITPNPKNKFMREVDEKDIRRYGVSHEEKSSIVKNKPITFVDVIKKKASLMKKKKLISKSLPLMDLDLKHDHEEETWQIIFCMGKICPLKIFEGRKMDKDPKTREVFHS